MWGEHRIHAPGCHVGVLDTGFLPKSFPKAVFSLGPLAMHTHIEFCSMADFYFKVGNVWGVQ